MRFAHAVICVMRVRLYFRGGARTLHCPRVYYGNVELEEQNFVFYSARSAMAEEEEEGVSVEQQLLLACQNGDVDTVHTLVTSVVGLDISLTTEDGATLITNTIIGAGSDSYHAKC